MKNTGHNSTIIIGQKASKGTENFFLLFLCVEWNKTEMRKDFSSSFPFTHPRTNWLSGPEIERPFYEYF